MNAHFQKVINLEGQLSSEKKISKMAAICGLVCSDCIAFDATQKNDDELRERVVKAWSTETNVLD